MKLLRFFLIGALLMLTANLASAALVFDFANVTGALIRFDGATNSFTFPNGVGGVDFLVTSQNSEWPGSVLNYTGDLIAPAGGWVFSDTGNPATVTGIGTLVLRNAANTATLTGDLVWHSIGTLGVGGTVNVFGSLNYTNLTLVGADANLAALLGQGGANVVISFQNINTAPLQGDPGTEDCSGLLGEIRCGGISTGSYSGTLESESVPEPASLLFVGAGLVGLGVTRFRRRRA